MSGSTRRAEFFVLEASEYLTDMERLVGRADTPDLERLVRGARALRGAALMAGLGTFARAAAALESLARQVRDHAIGWDPDARGAWREGLQTLRGLVSRTAGWEAADDRHALLLAERVERISKGDTQSSESPDVIPATAGRTGSMTPGVRAFIARESALIADSLQEAARALAPMEPPAALAGVLERLRSLRGLGDSTELSPLPELLDAMEVTTRSLLLAEPPPPQIAAVFADAADALGSMAKSVGEQGRVVVPTGLDRIARRLLEGFAHGTDVVEIASLAPQGEASIQRRGNRPIATPVGDPVPIELIGVGDHLIFQADALAAGRSPAARDLRLFVLHQTLTTMPGGSRTGRFLSPLSTAIARAIGNGSAHNDPDRFGTMLRECGQFLIEHGGDTNFAELASRRDGFAAALGTPGSLPKDQGSEAAMSELDIVEIASLAPTEPEIVEIASLAATDLASALEIVDIASLAPTDLTSALEIVDIASLAPTDPDQETDIVDIGSLAPEGASVETASRLERAYRRLHELESAAESSIPDITTLCYRGERALTRADEIRTELVELLSGTSVDLVCLRPLLDELLDLVPLAREAA